MYSRKVETSDADTSVSTSPDMPRLAVHVIEAELLDLLRQPSLSEEDKEGLYYALQGTRERYGKALGAEYNLGVESDNARVTLRVANEDPPAWLKGVPCSRSVFFFEDARVIVAESSVPYAYDISIDQREESVVEQRMTRSELEDLVKKHVQSAGTVLERFQSIQNELELKTIHTRAMLLRDYRERDLYSEEDHVEGDVSEKTLCHLLNSLVVQHLGNSILQDADMLLSKAAECENGEPLRIAMKRIADILGEGAKWYQLGIHNMRLLVSILIRTASPSHLETTAQQYFLEGDSYVGVEFALELIDALYAGNQLPA